MWQHSNVAVWLTRQRVCSALSSLVLWPVKKPSRGHPPGKPLLPPQGGSTESYTGNSNTLYAVWSNSFFYYDIYEKAYWIHTSISGVKSSWTTLRLRVVLVRNDTITAAVVDLTSVSFASSPSLSFSRSGKVWLMGAAATSLQDAGKFSHLSSYSTAAKEGREQRGRGDYLLYI